MSAAARALWLAALAAGALACGVKAPPRPPTAPAAPAQPTPNSDPDRK